ncbi:MAG TPA: DUF202 domain-containing protein [Pseudonocardiaceae bacterium]|nr:DUF202 domain-containing protein [Pseudonocardiaceae bacterium]
MSSPHWRCRPRGDGLQPERTALAWSRTSVGVLGNGALLLLRDLGHGAGPARWCAAGAAGVIAAGIYLVGRRRQLLLSRRPLPAPLAARGAIRLIGAAVVALIVVTAFALPL